MPLQPILNQFKALKASNRTGFAVLVDPDKISVDGIAAVAKLCEQNKVDFLFIGGSLLMAHQLEACIKTFKEHSNIPVILFPGTPAQVTPKADALLYLSLISGRNADLLIGQHVSSAPVVKASKLEVISTGYMLIDGGTATTVSYISHSMPIPANKPDIAVCTAWAGEMQGKHIIYMDAGSGAQSPISSQMIGMVSSNLEIPLIIGGGINTAEKAYNSALAGANIIVVGNAIEKDNSLIAPIAQAIQKANSEKK
jgi:phosphoglycerol geranylgeranyltransferase